MRLFFMRVRGALLATMMLAGCAAQAPMDSADSADRTSPNPQTVEIRRTSDGVPHIRASGWRELGYGYAYAQAEDNLCTMADSFVTFRGERSAYFGPDASLPRGSTMGSAKNIDADFFFKLLANDATVQAYKNAQSAQVRQLIGGFAAGYNAYLQTWRASPSDPAHSACKGQKWLSEISEADIYRRLYSANLAGGYSRFITAIATAAPPSLPAHSMMQPDAFDRLAAADLTRRSAATWMQAGGRAGIGSNGMAFGAAATGDASVLLGNPHWYWAGPDRFYQAQLTIPGVLDVGGASFLGVPVIMLGFNNAVAWTHTVSTARRFGFFEFQLAPDQPLSYLRDGVAEAMTATPLSVQALRSDGSTETVNRTLYRSRFGPLVNLAAFSPAMAWSGQKAFAMRDINAANFGVFENFLAWGKSSSLDEFISIQKKLAAMPWVNTLAIGRGDANAWYADIGAIPNVPDALAATCTTALGKAFARGAAGVPFLDGSRSACDWQEDPQAVVKGGLPVAAMPALKRRDYVANMNNSYWLANPAAPLVGFAHIIGQEQHALGLRARLGYEMAAQRLAGTDGLPGRLASVDAIKTIALNSRSAAAELAKQELLGLACQGKPVMVSQDLFSGKKYAPPQTVDVAEACEVLRNWGNTAGAGDRGAYLWDQFWLRATQLGDAKLFRTPFDANDPLHTPANLDTNNPAVAEAFGAAVLAIRQAGRSVATAQGQVLYVDKGTTRIPLYGGCDGLGYFTATCHVPTAVAGEAIVDADITGNSHLQVVSFDRQGVKADVMLAHGESDDADSVRFSQDTLQYANRQWSRWRFTRAEQQEDAGMVLKKLVVPAN